MGLLDMLSANLVCRARIIFYAVLIFFSFFIFIGSAVLKDDIGICMLYCDDKQRTHNNMKWITSSDCGPESNCNYPIAISIIFQLLFLLFRVGSLVALVLGKLNTELFIFSDIMELVYVAVDLIAFFFTFIGACILSAGTNYTCDQFRCTDDSGWYEASKVAQAGAWISTFVWLAVGIMGFLFLMRSGKIPFLGGGSRPAGQQGGPGAQGSEPSPNQEPPPYNPDEIKY